MHIGRTPVKAKKESLSDFLRKVYLFSQSKCPAGCPLVARWRERCDTPHYHRQRFGGKPVPSLSVVDSRAFLQALRVASRMRSRQAGRPR